MSAHSISHAPAARSFPPVSEYIKVFDGECSDGSEIRMYEGDGDNPGSAEERALRCSEACLHKKEPLSGSWTDFIAKGFIVASTTGECFCESSDAFTCTRHSNAYDRYAWESSGQ